MHIFPVAKFAAKTKTLKLNKQYLSGRGKFFKNFCIVHEMFYLKPNFHEHFKTKLFLLMIKV